MYKMNSLLTKIEHCSPFYNYPIVVPFFLRHALFQTCSTVVFIYGLYNVL